MAGVSQLELDALCSGPGDMEAPPSPQGSCLRRRRRGIPASSMSEEIASLKNAVLELSASPGLSQRELDKVGIHGGDFTSCKPKLDSLFTECGDMECPPSPQDSFLRKRRLKISVSAMSAEIAALVDAAHEQSDAHGIAQRELDKVGIDSGDFASCKQKLDSGFTEYREMECPPSPQDSLLRKRRLKISVSAMSGEIAALVDAAHGQSDAPGLAQRELDKVGVDGEEADQCSSPVSSGLLRIKRSRFPVGQGRAGAAAQAPKLFVETSLATAPTGSMGLGLSQQQLDLICSGNPERNSQCSGQDDATRYRSPGSKRRVRRVSHVDENQNCTKHDENMSPVRTSSKDLSYGSPKSPPSPCRGRSVNQPLSPVKLN